MILLQRFQALRLIIGLAGLLAFFLATAPQTFAQDGSPFTVIVEEKTSEHPHFNEGFPSGFTVDGEQGKELAFTRGTTYTFQMDDVPSFHPFYLTTNERGSGAGSITEGVSGNEQLTFTPTASTPDTIYYNCVNHAFMGYRINIESAGGGGGAVDSVGLDLRAEGLTSPVTLAEPPDGSGSLFIVDQAGVIRVLMPDGTLLDEPFLDLREQIVDLRSGFDERGLLGLAFHPAYADNGRFFVYYSAPLRDSAPDDFNHTSRISEFQVSDSDPNRADPNSEEILLQVDEPQFNHNAGTLAFGPDNGYLYISLGDGGGANDTDTGHVSDWYDDNEGGNGQDVTENLLGSILRIDVDGGDPYGIPSGNPFVGQEGRNEIYAYGFRNPYRFSFDMGGEHRLFAADAGQNRWEEVDTVARGGNYGWNVREGTHCFDAANPSDPQITSCPDTDPEGDPLIDPVIEYANANQESGGVGLSVVGGHVYRGSALPELDGHYVFGDFSSSFGRPRGQIFAATARPDSLWSFEKLTISSTSDGELGRFLLGLGQDRSGEMYVLTSDSTGPTGTSGQVFEIVPAGEGTASDPPARLSDEAGPVLQPNHPNPFVTSTTIRFTLPRAQHVRLEVYDVLGRRVAALTEGRRASGTHRVSFNASQLPSGVYVYRLTAGATIRTRTMTIVR
jgi:glucose/arabinose dehydrogenase